MSGNRGRVAQLFRFPSRRDADTLAKQFDHIGDSLVEIAGQRLARRIAPPDLKANGSHGSSLHTKLRPRNPRDKPSGTGVSRHREWCDNRIESHNGEQRNVPTQKDL